MVDNMIYIDIIVVSEFAFLPELVFTIVTFTEDVQEILEAEFSLSVSCVHGWNDFLTKASISQYSTSMEEVSAQTIKFNHIHKRFMVLYDLTDMRQVWKAVARDWKVVYKTKLPKRFKAHPEIWQELNSWIEGRILGFVLSGGEDVMYYNKADLQARGWDDKILKILYPNPDKKVYLGRGRYAYYYHGTRLGELEDSEEFIEYIANKLERKRKRESARLAKLDKPNVRSTGFGSEWVR